MIVRRDGALVVVEYDNGERGGFTCASEEDAETAIEIVAAALLPQYLKEEYRKRTERACPRPGCSGTLRSMVSEDGSAYVGDACEVCGAQWWNDPPLAASEAP